MKASIHPNGGSMAVLLVVGSFSTFVAGSFNDDGSGTLHVKGGDNEVFKASYEQAFFGPDLPESNELQSYIYTTDPPDACSKLCQAIMPPAPGNKMPIALIPRSQCNFVVKVLNAQEAGFKAVIVYDNIPDEDTFRMVSNNYTLSSEVNISSVFVSYEDGRTINRSYTCAPLQPCQFVAYFSMNSVTIVPFLIGCVVVLGVCFLATIVFLAVRWIREIRRRRKNRVSRSQLNKIPSRKFKKGDTYDACAICLDDYNEGDKIRILPCSHAYHIKCIDPWLLNNKRTCPVCKRKAVPGTSSDDSDADDDRRTASVRGASTTERTPLLPPPAPPAVVGEESSSTSARPSHDAAGQPATRFYGSGLPAAFEHEISLESSSSDESSEDECHVDHNDMCLLLSLRPSRLESVTAAVHDYARPASTVTSDSDLDENAPASGGVAHVYGSVNA